MNLLSPKSMLEQHRAAENPSPVLWFYNPTRIAGKKLILSMTRAVSKIGLAGPGRTCSKLFQKALKGVLMCNMRRDPK